MVKSREEKVSAYDSEWVSLISEAKEIGLKPEEVRDFILNIDKSKI